MRVGIIGTGWGTRVQVPAFRSAGLDVVGIAARDVVKTRREAADLGVAAFDTWQELLAEGLDLISIVTPPRLHREMAEAALQAGLHVVCEKPTAFNAEEAASMYQAAQAHPQQLALIDHELRFLPVVRLAQTLINSGAIGSPRTIQGQVVFSSRADPSRPWNWWSDKDQAGGVWGAIGSHQIDLLRFLCGEIAAISATLRTFITERPYEATLRPVTSDDFVAAQLHLACGAIAQLTLNAVAAVSAANTLIIHGERGALRLEGGKLFFASLNGEWEDRTPAHAVEMPEGINGMFPEGTVYLGHALKAWAEGDSSALDGAATFADGYRNQEILDAGRRSDAENGCLIAIPQQR